MSSRAFEARASLARRQLLHEPLKLGLALIGTAPGGRAGWAAARSAGGHRPPGGAVRGQRAGGSVLSTSDAHAVSVPGTSALPASMQGALLAAPGVVRRDRAHTSWRRPLERAWKPPASLGRPGT
jgi:hypothetical protein